MTILFNAEKEQLEEITIFDSKGQVLLRISQETTIGMNALQVDVSPLASGVYFVKLKNAAAVERLVKL